MIRTTLALLATLGTQSALAATVIHAGFLFDTKEGELLEKQTITIEGGRVVSVNDGFLAPEGSTVIDLSAAYVSPGFMDMHVHLDGELDPPASYSEEFFMNSADIALRSTVFARRTLDAGFTTVRDLGAGDIQAALHCVMQSQKILCRVPGFSRPARQWRPRVVMRIQRTG